MPPYLTAKSAKVKKGLWLAAGLCILIALVSVSNDIDYIKEGDVTQIAAGFLVTFLFVYPAVRIIRNAFLRARAQRIARCLADYQEATVSFKKLSIEMGADTVKAMQRLLEKGYLQDLRIDYEHSMVELISPNHMRENIYAEVTCPHCGAKNLVIQGRIGRCEFCDSPLMANQESEKIRQ
ncbi:MAG: hypothetical protein SO016_04915 [Lachnospiraceae bacterium]|nr:hypothetical protein [Robinsoniella sp.]MDY3766023.1 hypothetical protein [Lachnospiraceae bacterium]